MSGRVVALCGGVGGAKLALGLARVLPDGLLSVVGNTGDDFQHLGLSVSPDIDTLVYTLAGLADPVNGWGRRDETWNFMASLGQLGGESWFRIGDRDLAMHVERSRRLATGEPLSAFTDDIRRRLDITSRVLPMSDDPVRTRVRTDGGWLDFQEYFVRQRCMPRVQAVAYTGAETASPLPEAVEALGDAGLRAVIICPSNPYLSIAPMLAIPGLRLAVQRSRAPVIAVSPIIGDRAVKGPTAKMMSELGVAPGAAAVAQYYADIVDAFVVDDVDARAAAPAGVKLVSAPILMNSLEDRKRLARLVLEAADELSDLKRNRRAK